MITDPIADLLVRLGNAARRRQDVVKVPVEEARPMITGMRRISKPGRRVYVGRDDVPKVRNGIGVAVISTSKGLMTDSDSRRSGLGGEVLCSVW